MTLMRTLSKVKNEHKLHNEILGMTNKFKAITLKGKEGTEITCIKIHKFESYHSQKY